MWPPLPTFGMCPVGLESRDDSGEGGWPGKQGWIETSRVLLEKWRKREHLYPGLLVAHVSAGGELREEQGSMGTMNFGTGSVCRSDVPFPGWVFAGFGVSGEDGR